MKLVNHRTRRLSLAVAFHDSASPNLQIEEDELDVSINHQVQTPRYHHAGYWLVMDLNKNVVNLQWKAKHYEDGERTIEINKLSKMDPVVTIELTKPSPVSISLQRLSRGKVGIDYRKRVTTSGGKAPFTFEAINLPAGLSIDRETGLIKGIPSENIRCYVTLRVWDHNGTSDESINRITVLK
jgi:hypothetical protein